ncbi:MAG: ATP-binding protein [Myxococcales bacterium]|nr:ATP-binding protein [Myxococcales bacterium]
MSGASAAVIIYLALTITWALVLALYLRHRSASARDPLLAMLLSVLALDAFKSVFESGYFGLVWGANYGVLPEAFKALGEPGPLVAVKVLNLVVAGVVLFRLARSWVPNELRRREAQRAELELRLKHSVENEETLRLAVAASSELLWDGDLRTGRVTGSPEAAKWLGYEPHEWPPSPWTLVVHEDDRALVQQAIAETIKGQTRSYRVQHRVRRKDGTVLHALSTGVVARDATGRAIRFVGSIRDITHELAEEGRRLQAQKFEGLGLLAGGIAHDFNNLLTVVGSSLELAKLRGGSRPELVEPLQTASLAVSRAAVLTRELLAYAGRAPTEHKPIDLNELVDAIGDLLAVSISRKVTFQRVLDPALPALVGDPAQLQQVVMNLITNAAEAIGDRPGTITLRTGLVVLERSPATRRSGDVTGRVVRLTVSDTGAGMTPEVQARIFDPFFSTKGSGRGLGLAALAGILKAHGGAIGLESTPGAGSTFTIELPALDAPLSRPAPVAADARKALTLNVLLVDDEPMLRRSARRLLEELGCRVDEAETGRAAVERIRDAPGRWHVVLMDVTMPELNGIEAAEQMRQLAPDLPIILSSGYSAEADAVSDARVLQLPKPYSFEKLEAVLRQATGC